MPSTIKPKPFTLLDPLEDKLPGPVRALVDFLKPAPEDIIGLPIPAAPAISIFKDAAGVPSRALREAGTRAFDAALDNLPASFQGAGYRFAKKYPRIAAHMRPRRMDEDKVSAGIDGIAEIPDWVVKEPVPVQFNPAKYRDADRLFAHEGTHVAQALGNRYTLPLYQSANDVWGYVLNPFETAARRAELRGIAGYPPPLPKGYRNRGGNAIRALENISRPTVFDRPGSIPEEKLFPLNRIRNILNIRKGMPLTKIDEIK